MTGGLKDEALSAIADQFNVAQFASFGPGSEPRLRRMRVVDPPSGASFSLGEVVRLLLARATGGLVNVRAFRPERPKGNPFHYGLDHADAVEAVVRHLAAEGLFTIVNETIDVQDGGVSGVLLGGIAEFAPGGTPRVVEEPGVLSAPASLAARLLRTVYDAELPDVGTGLRVEFSVHPAAAGVRGERTIVWEVEHQEAELEAELRWPNRFSQHLGDKAFGLLVADALGAPVPRTRVLARSVAPFELGRSTDHDVTWVRTAPRSFAAGRYSTVRGWTDPFALLAKEDPDGSVIGSVLVQAGVRALWSGAARVEDDHLVVEGVGGEGDRFMLGEQPPGVLPADVDDRVRRLASDLRAQVGPLRLEWADNGELTWVLQLNQISVETHGTPQGASGWLAFDPLDGLEALSGVIERARDAGVGVHVTRPVGRTSHVGDLLRLAGVPARFAPS